MVLVEPVDLVRAAGRSGELVFAHEHGDTPWLLVRLSDPNDEFAAALRASTTNSPSVRPTGPLAFHTEAISVAAIRMRGGGTPLDLDIASVVRDLGDSKYHASAIRKRSDIAPAFEDRISVGRATNKDLVFRHSSISKFHAYFQLSESDGLAVADAGSKNGTLVNGRNISSREPAVVTTGDQITFGTVWCLLLDARTLWRVLRHR